ncbi:ABC transporter permease [Pedobacter sp. AK017]|uniref:ABC transporter permease n=1 Tax=Pedobacter sp. AK017 TaxID=2723073 RepID=UPI00161C70E8|nr:ABC transporter permease [Pedobacter sp. AK017]
MNYKKAWSFIKKDFIIESSYKLNFIQSLFTSIFPIVSFFFIGKMVAGNHLAELEKYGGRYFPFVLIGIAFVRFFQLAVDTFSTNIKRAQMAGCLEAILSAQTDPKAIVVMSSLYSFLSAGLQLVLMFLIAVIFLGYDFSTANVPATMLTLTASLIIFISLGIFSAAGTVIFKQGEPIGWIFGVASALLGGAMFPVAVMPGWLQQLSLFFPLTYALDALRLALLKGNSIIMLSQQLFILGGMAVFAFPLSLKTFEWAIEKGKKDGTLMQY